MRIRQHVNPLGPYFERFRGSRVACDDRAIEIEIGCADAQFLFERAAAAPQRRYIGLEIREDLVDLVNKRARDTGAPVEAVFCQAQLHLGEIFDAASVDRVYLNFPDPWFKNRHKVRRMIDRRLAVGIHHVARAGADVFVQSDVWEVALDAMDVFERQADRFVNQAGEWSFWRGGNPYAARSWREQHAYDTGLPIWRLLYRRR
jgi:tRNA (guanine-N7-)-methyltransferase